MWKRAFPCRCTRCERRRSLAMKPADYERDHYARCQHCPPNFCVLCGHRRGTKKKAHHCDSCRRYAAPLMRVDWYRKRREHTRNNCNCGAYPFQHRRGSLWCVHGAGGRAGISYFDSDTDFALHFRQGFIHLIGREQMNLSVISAANRQFVEAVNPAEMEPLPIEAASEKEKFALDLGRSLLELDRCAQRLGIDLGAAAVNAFNRQSERAGQPMRIELERAS